CAAFSSTSLRRPTMTTLPPSWAIRAAAANPIPSPPPVMIAVFPSSPSSITWLQSDFAVGLNLAEDPQRRQQQGRQGNRKQGEGERAFEEYPEIPVRHFERLTQGAFDD